MPRSGQLPQSLISNRRQIDRCRMHARTSGTIACSGEDQTSAHAPPIHALSGLITRPRAGSE
jgi:hypothetical protein